MGLRLWFRLVSFFGCTGTCVKNANTPPPEKDHAEKNGTKCDPKKETSRSVTPSSLGSTTIDTLSSPEDSRNSFDDSDTDDDDWLEIEFSKAPVKATASSSMYGISDTKNAASAADFSKAPVKATTSSSMYGISDTKNAASAVESAKAPVKATPSSSLYGIPNTKNALLFSAASAVDVMVKKDNIGSKVNKPQAKIHPAVRFRDQVEVLGSYIHRDPLSGTRIPPRKSILKENTKSQPNVPNEHVTPKVSVQTAQKNTKFNNHTTGTLSKMSTSLPDNSVLKPNQEAARTRSGTIVGKKNIDRKPTPPSWLKESWKEAKCKVTKPKSMLSHYNDPYFFSSSDEDLPVYRPHPTILIDLEDAAISDAAMAGRKSADAKRCEKEKTSHTENQPDLQSGRKSMLARAYARLRPSKGSTDLQREKQAQKPKSRLSRNNKIAPMVIGAAGPSKINQIEEFNFGADDGPVDLDAAERFLAMDSHNHVQIPKSEAKTELVDLDAAEAFISSDLHRDYHGSSNVSLKSVSSDDNDCRLGDGPPKKLRRNFWV